MIHDIDTIRISIKAHVTWLGYIYEEIRKLPDDNIVPGDISDEQFRELPDGTGEIFMNVRGKELKLLVPKGEWSKPTAP